LPTTLLECLGELSATPNALDALCHNDLQTGNLVVDENERVRVVDLDNLSVGTFYSDGLTGLLFRGAPKETLEQFC
jgi:Ser/Thr protein kinase RdoA (MazF antagonist)